MSLVDDWHAATTERERAHVENEIWERMDRSTHSAARHGAAAKIAVELCDATARHAVAQRRTVFLAEPWSGLLWRRVEPPELMPLKSAAALVSFARRRARELGGQPGEYLLGLVEEYDRMPKRVQRGRTCRYGFRKLADALPADPDAGLWERVGSMVRRHVRDELPGLDVLRADEVRRDFEQDLRAAIELMRSRVRALKQPDALAEVTKAALRAACDELQLPCPRNGTPIEGASKRYRQIARTLHPDAAPGREDDFRRVTEAYEVVSRHNAAVEKKKEQRA